MNCKHCNDTGVNETGNNDLPCEECALGATAIFNCTDGHGGHQETGMQVFLEYNPPHRPIPGPWEDVVKKRFQPGD